MSHNVQQTAAFDLPQATRGACNPNLQVAITHERLVCGQNEPAFVWTSTKNERNLWRAI